MKHMIDGVRYHVERRGQGFPLILLHGFTGDATTWEPLCEALEDQAECFAVDIIGHGKTDSPHDISRYRMMSVVDDLYLLMEKLRLAKADILGYSMGGRLALSFAEKYPRKVRKLILESSSPGLKTEEERKARREKDEQLAAFIEEKGILECVKYWENIPLFASQKKLPANVRKKIREQRLRNSPAGLAASLRGMGTGVQPSWWDDLENLDVETLLITGSLDEKFCRIAQQMSEKLPRCRRVVVPGCGHAIHVEDCEKFVTIVKEFLSDTSLAGDG